MEKDYSIIHPKFSLPFIIFLTLTLFIILARADYLDTGALAQNVDSCGTLNTTNAVYTLIQNVTSNSTCFSIQANNITLDGAGYTINYSSIGDYGTAVNVSGYNYTTIKNLNILEGSNVTSGKYGISIYKGNSTIIQNNTLKTYSTSISYYGNNGTIIGNTVNVTGSASSLYGVQLYGPSHNNLISSNNISMASTASSSSALAMQYGDNNNISSNNLYQYSSTGQGISFGQGSTLSSNNTFEKNYILSADYGIRLPSSPGVTSRGTYFSEIRIYSADYSISAGDQLSTSTNFTMVNSILNSTAATGFRIPSTVNNDIWNFTNVTKANGSPLTINWTSGANGTLLINWHLELNISDYVSGAAIANANVSLWDSNNNLQFTELAANGTIKKILLQYIRNETSGTNYAYSTPYILNVTNTSYENYTNSSINLTNNIFINVRLIQSGADIIYPTFANFSDNNGTINANGIAWFNSTLSDTNGTVFLQINNTNYTATNLSNVYNVSVNLSEGIYPYYWISYGNGSASNFNISGVRYYTINGADVVPPSSITRLAASFQTNSSIYWSWTSPSDSDFNKSLLYINNTNIANTTDNYYNITALDSDSFYTLSVRTMDNTGNINTTEVNSTSRTYNNVISPSRMIIWSAGIPGGIPNRTVICANVTDPMYNATGNGITDDTSAIQNAINNCTVNQTVYIPQGVYNLTATLSVNKGIVLRGDGINKTILASSPTTTIASTSGNIAGNIYFSVTEGHIKGSKNITLIDASALSVGNYILITQENENATNIANSTGASGNCTWCGILRCSSNHSIQCSAHGISCDNGNGICEGGKRTIGQILRITQKNSNTLSFEPSLNWNYNSTADPRVIKINSATEYVGLENLKIQFNTSDAGDAGIGFQSNYCAYCWARNIEIAGAPRQAIRSYGAYMNEYRDSYIHDTYSNFPLSNHGYGILLEGYSTSNLVENNMFTRLLTVLTLESGSTGNVFGYNYIDRLVYYSPTWLIYDLSTHGAHPYMNLYEGNKGLQAHFDNIWGSSSHITLFRNRLLGNQINATDGTLINSGRWAVTLDYGNTYMNVLGNVLGEPNFTGYYEMKDDNCSLTSKAIYRLGYFAANCNSLISDPLVLNTLLRHGNFDYSTNDTVWDPSSSDHNLSASLYLPSRPSWWSADLTWPAYDGTNGSTTENKIPAEVRFEAMSSALEISITYPTNTSYSVNVSSLNYTASNAQSCWYSTDGGNTNISVDCGTNLVNLTSAEGSNTWLIGANNTNETLSLKITFIKDTVYPVFSNLSDDNGTIVNNGTATFNVAILNTNGTVFLQINNTNYTATNLTTNAYNVSLNLTNGTYSYIWISYGNGSTNNYNSSVARYYTLNSTPSSLGENDTLLLIFPANRSGSADGNATMAFRMDNSTAMDNCSLILDNSLNLTNATVTDNIIQRFRITNMLSGIHNWSIECRNSSNANTTSELRFIYVTQAPNFEGNTTNWSAIDMKNASIVLEKLNKGRINFTQRIDLSNVSDIDSYINISQNRIFLNSSALSVLNVSAELVLYNLSFNNPRILKDGLVCIDCTRLSYSGGNLEFNVSSFSEYTSEETPASAETPGSGGGGGGGVPTKKTNVTNATLTTTTLNQENNTPKQINEEVNKELNASESEISAENTNSKIQKRNIIKWTFIIAITTITLLIVLIVWKLIIIKGISSENNGPTDNMYPNTFSEN